MFPAPRVDRRALLACLSLLLCLAAGAAARPAHAQQLAGVQTHVLWSDVDAGERDRQMDLARNAGARIMRVDVGWSSLQPDSRAAYSQWYLNRLDGVVDAARARGIELVLMFWETPCWASRAPDAIRQGCAGSWWSRGVQRYGPTNPADYANALAYVVRRYGSRVAAWEIWNEPNSSDFFNAADKAADYTRLVKAAYPAAKAASSSATILAGSVMQADHRFTQQLYDNGIKGFFDGFSIHPYSDDRSPLDRGDDRWIQVSYIRGVPAVRDVMLRNGDDTPMWLTEFGWSTNTLRTAENWQNGVTEAEQAAYVGQALGQMRSWSYVKAAIYYDLVDEGTDPANTIQNFGLVRSDHGPKPAYAAFRSGADAVAAGASLAPSQRTSSTSASGRRRPRSTTAVTRAVGTRGATVVKKARAARAAKAARARSAKRAAAARRARAASRAAVARRR